MEGFNSPIIACMTYQGSNLQQFSEDLTDVNGNFVQVDEKRGIVGLSRDSKPDLAKQVIQIPLETLQEKFPDIYEILWLFQMLNLSSEADLF